MLAECVHTIWIIPSNECSDFVSSDVSLSVKTKEKVRRITSTSKGELSSLQDTQQGKKQGDHRESLRTFSSNKEGKKNGRKEQESGIQSMEAAEDNREVS